MKVTFIIIDDTPDVENHALLYRLQDREFETKFFIKPEIGLKYINENLDKNIIVLLDIQFSPSDKETGHTILEKIAHKSELIPVILWSGINQTEESFHDFINNRAFGFISKDCSIDEALVIIDKALDHLKNSLDNAIEEWILSRKEDKDKPIYITSDGHSFSLNDILNEIRLQTPTGKEFSRKLNSLTIDLLLRGKEKLNG